MAEMFYDDDADLSVIQGRKVAVIGYGSQGHAHALNLRDSGVDVRVGLAEGSASRAKAEDEGLRVLNVADAVKEADLVVILTPDQVQRTVYAEQIQPNLREGAALLFGHGFNIRFGYIAPEAGSDVIMVAPKGPGHLVRREYVDGHWPPPMPRPSAACGPAESRPPSRRSARPTSSASRPSCAVAPRNWSCTASRPSSRPATSLRSPTSNACTSSSSSSTS